MKTIKVPRKLKKACKKAIQNRFNTANLQTKNIGICGLSTGKRYTDNRDFYIMAGNIAVTAHRSY